MVVQTAAPAIMRSHVSTHHGARLAQREFRRRSTWDRPIPAGSRADSATGAFKCQQRPDHQGKVVVSARGFGEHSPLRLLQKLRRVGSPVRCP